MNKSFWENISWVHLCVEFVLQSISREHKSLQYHIFKHMMETVRLESGLLGMVVFGVLATILSPFIIIIIMMQSAVKVLSVMVPLFSLVVLVVIGVPVLAMCRLAYNTFGVTHRIFQFCYKGTIANLKHIDKNENRRNYSDSDEYE